MTLHPAQVGRRRHAWVIRTPEGRHLLGGEREARLLSLMDGSRTVTELAEAAAPGTPDPVRAVAGFIACLSGRGVLEGGEGGRPRRPAVGRRVSLGDPTPLLAPACDLLRGLPPQTATAALGVLLAGGLVGALQHGERLAASLAPVALWNRLPTTMALAWVLGLAHETAHAAAAVLGGGRVRAMGIALARWRLVFFVDIPDLILLPRAVRIRIAAAGPLTDAALAAAALLLVGLGPRGEGAAFPLATAAVVRVAWNLLPALWTDGAYLLSEIVGVPGMEARARRALLAVLWPSRRSAGRARGVHARPTRAGLCLMLYGLLSVVLEGALVLLLGLRAASAVRGP